MRWILRAFVLSACLSIAPVAAQEGPEKPRKPGLVERAKLSVKQILDQLLQDYGGFLDAVDKAMESGDLGTDGDKVVIQLNTRLATLKTDVPPDRHPGADTPTHEVNHLSNSEQFLNSAAAEAMDTLLYLTAMEFETSALDKYAKDAPKKAEALLKDLEWADRELRGMVDRLSGSPTPQDLEREKRLLAGIKTTLSNISKVLASEVERGDEWLDEVEKTGGDHTKGLEKIRLFQAEKVEGKAAAQLLPAVVSRVRTAAQSWMKSSEVAIKANEDARKEAKNALEVFTKDVLLKKLESFKNVKFADLAGTTEENEKFLKVLEGRLKGR